jgi:hypothetical protein
MITILYLNGIWRDVREGDAEVARNVLPDSPHRNPSGTLDSIGRLYEDLGTNGTSCSHFSYSTTISHIFFTTVSRGTLKVMIRARSNDTNA